MRETRAVGKSKSPSDDDALFPYEQLRVTPAFGIQEDEPAPVVGQKPVRGIVRYIETRLQRHFGGQGYFAHRCWPFVCSAPFE